jgi:hypothetical protein
MSAEARILFHHRGRWKEEKTQWLLLLPPCIPSAIDVLGGGLLDGERMRSKWLLDIPTSCTKSQPPDLSAKWK